MATKNIIDSAFITMLESRDLVVKNPMKGLFGGNRRSKSYGSSVEFADFREYTPGDDLRRIDWNLYARFEKLFLRLFVDEKQVHHRIYIDTSASMDWGKPNKSHSMLKIAAALGFLSVQAMDRVSFHLMKDDLSELLGTTVVGRESFYSVANMLNTVEFKGECDIGRAITSIEKPGRGNGLSVIISDFLTDSDWQSAVDYLLHNGREVFLVQVLSRDEVTPNFSGKVYMTDSEASFEEDDRNFKYEVTRSAIKAYRQAFEYHQSLLKNFCASRDAGFISVCSDKSIEEMLFMYATEGGLIK